MKRILNFFVLGLVLSGVCLMATAVEAKIKFSNIDKETPSEGYGGKYGGPSFDPKAMDEDKMKNHS
ncbi:MAG: hypothetical protein IJY58_04540 [Alphaproteobacteria bacterium]|nr:hypothetical protein [Alphaproteobacteria bacterium]